MVPPHGLDGWGVAVVVASTRHAWRKHHVLSLLGGGGRGGGMGGERAIFLGGQAAGASMRRRGHRGVEIMVAAQQPCPARSGEAEQVGDCEAVRKKRDERDKERGRAGERAPPRRRRFQRGRGCSWLSWEDTRERRRMDRERLARAATVPRTVQID
jgi:hypothetical protein